MKSVDAQRIEMSSCFDRIIKKSEQSNVDAAIASILRSVDEHKRDMDRVMLSNQKAMTDAMRENAVDLRPFQMIVKEAKAETDQTLAQVIKATSELQNAMSWSIPSKLSEIGNQLRALESKVNLVYRLTPSSD